ncbi:MAG: hypothetical protein QXL76_00935 [Candidatus Rehaiarchaeum fermentans]|nr:hypothetical protein [Candidatus Rehaiarchaeum fermentans]
MSIEDIILKSIHEIYNSINSVLSFPWISRAVPNRYIQYLAPISLIIAGYLSEHNYVGRIPIFTNTIALNVLFYYSEYNLLYYDGFVFSVLKWYANIGIIMGVIAMVSYASRG